MATKRSNEISRGSTQVPKREEKSNQSNINSFFKMSPSVHTSLSRMNVNSGLSKAYRVPIMGGTFSVANKALTISKIEITKPKSNKAPYRYIPVRKVPSYMLNERKNVNDSEQLHIASFIHDARLTRIIIKTNAYNNYTGNNHKL